MHQDAPHPGTYPLARVGLEILYAKPGPAEHMAAGAARDLAKELRERFWIRAAGDAGTGPRTWAVVQVSLQWPIERVAVGRDRNDPGDGFRYVFRTGTDGTDSRAEWFEVTEVFEGIDAADVESFMRLENGGRGGPEFDPQAFVTGLDLGIPRRAAQRRAADKVLAAVDRKLAKPSYERMPRDHGYGTLIVGLPLWFATDPFDPLRPENAIDDFATRVLIGLRTHARELRKKSCPFWRVVVVWKGSLESARQWRAKARLDVYEDPAHSRLGSLRLRTGTMETILLDALGAVGARDGEGRRTVPRVHPEPLDGQARQAGNEPAVAVAARRRGFRATSRGRHATAQAKSPGSAEDPRRCQAGWKSCASCGHGESAGSSVGPLPRCRRPAASHASRCGAAPYDSIGPATAADRHGSARARRDPA